MVVSTTNTHMRGKVKRLKLKLKWNQMINLENEEAHMIKNRNL